MRNTIGEVASQGRALPVASKALKCFDEAAKEELNASDAVTLPGRWMKCASKK